MGGLVRGSLPFSLNFSSLSLVDMYLVLHSGLVLGGLVRMEGLSDLPFFSFWRQHGRSRYEESKRYDDNNNNCQHQHMIRYTTYDTRRMGDSKAQQRNMVGFFPIRRRMH